LVLNSAIAKFGSTSQGTQVWQDFRRANDPEADTTVHGQSFPYQDRVNINANAVAIPDPGSLEEGSPDDATGGGGGLLGGLLGPLGGLGGASNALLVSANESQSGHPEVVFGPQVAYFAPEILMEEDLHGPDIDARGATFVGVNLYVLLGRGQDFAWSATSAGQDIIDTFAEKLCEPGGGTPTIDSMHYLYKGECLPIEVLDRDQTITPNPGDPSPPGGFGPYHLEAQRTVHGIVSKRGTVDGQPVAFTKLRSTYFHEADSARAFADMNRPSKVKNASDFQKVMSKINFTFNWFYTDDKDISYFNSGDNPVRAPGTDPEFPAWGTGQWDWQGWDPVTDPSAPGLSGGTNIADYTPFAQHPRVTNQDYISSWNNKQAPGYRAADDNYSYGPNHRVQSLSERIEAGIAGGNTMSLQEVIDAMEDGGSVDLRGSQDLELMLDVIRDGPGGVPAPLQGDVDVLQSWIDGGAHRRDRDSSGTYDDSRAVAIMDAWWPKALEAAFKPTIGDVDPLKDVFAKVQAQMAFDDPPSLHLGSAYLDGWEGYLSKDLRTLLGDPVDDPFSRGYCGAGSLAACRTALVNSLQDAITVVDDTGTPQYPAPDSSCPFSDPQRCFDAISFRTVGGVSVDDIEWINRPTWQQAVEVQGHRTRGGGGAAGTTAAGIGIANPAPSGQGKRCKKKKRKHARKRCRRKRHRKHK
jgi:hypothetical protein